LLSKRVLWHHENARPYPAAAAVEAMTQMKSEFFPQSATSDCLIFGPLKKPCTDENLNFLRSLDQKAGEPPHNMR
jgi:hypothetical protein